MLINTLIWNYHNADYMLNKLHIEESQVPKMCLDLYKEHGTTMAGLKVVSEYFFLGELFLNTDT